MGFFERLFRREPASGQIAKERLQLVLVHDRAGLSPEMMNQLRDELIAVVQKYVDIDPSGMEFELTQTREQSKLVANIPLRTGGRGRSTADW
ncbi:MAG: cell division topological specificity factor MinE [Ardenticatenaceae bacterium]|nr:cell division topological specificity factor MinE [Ardenticatenaceae bacterium]HBY98990.1 cell division topological specificity factor MinE [Chloroflexota bacterium]